MTGMPDMTISVAALLAAGQWELLIQVAMSALIFFCLFFLVIGVFGQAGEVHLSPERASALATGHSDRTTVFENAFFRPPLWLLLVATHRFSAPRLKGWIRRQLVATGNQNYYTPEEYLALSLMVGIICAVVLEVGNILATGNLSVTLPIVGLLGGVILAIAQLHSTASKRARLISKRVPYALDLIALAMGAGATFIEAVKTIVREDQADPFNVELRTLLAEMELGTTRRKALQNLAERIPLEELRSIIASVIQAEELGTPLGDVLHDQATLLRLQRSVHAEQAAAVASVRILIPCLLLVLAVVLAVFGPAILRVIRRGLF